MANSVTDFLYGAKPFAGQQPSFAPPAPAPVAPAPAAIPQAPAMQPQPPATPEEFEQRKQGWTNLLTRFREDPVLQRAVMMFGAQLSSPMPQNQGPLGQIGLGLARATDVLTGAQGAQDAKIKFAGDIPVRVQGGNVYLPKDGGWVPYSDAFYKELAGKKEKAPVIHMTNNLPWRQNGEKIEVSSDGTNWIPADEETIKFLMSAPEQLRSAGGKLFQIQQGEDGTPFGVQLKDEKGNPIEGDTWQDAMMKFNMAQAAINARSNQQIATRFEIQERSFEQQRKRDQEQEAIREKKEARKQAAKEMKEDEETVATRRSALSRPQSSLSPKELQALSRPLKSKQFKTKQNLLLEEFMTEIPYEQRVLHLPSWEPGKAGGVPWQAKDGNFYRFENGKFIKIDVPK